MEIATEEEFKTDAQVSMILINSLYSGSRSFPCAPHTLQFRIYACHWPLRIEYATASGNSSASALSIARQMDKERQSLLWQLLSKVVAMDIDSSDLEAM